MAKARRAGGGGARGRARRLFEQGRLHEALAAYQELCRRNPRDAECHYMLGSTLGRLQRMGEALGPLQRAAELAPRVAITHAALGAALEALGRLGEAEAAYRRAVALQPSLVEAQLELGRLLLRGGRPQEAEACYRRALRDRPQEGRASLGLGQALEAQGRASEAAAAYRRYVELEPASAFGRLRLGIVLHALGALEEAERHLRRACELEPGSPDVYRFHGLVLTKLGRREEAMQAYRRGLEVSAEDLDLVACEADLLDQEGEVEAAYERVASFVERGVDHPGLGIVLANVCRHVGRCEEAVAYLERQRSRGDLQPEIRAEVCFALGKLYDRAGRYDEAFATFREANGLMRLRFDEEAHAADIDGLIEIFTPGFLERAPRAKVETELPLFVIGLPRSGTSLVEQIVASHPQAAGAGEIGDIGHFVERLVGRRGGRGGYPECFRHLTARELDAMAQEYVDHLRRLAPGAVRVTDKMLQNYQHLGLIALLFPRARVIHIRRDPRDNALSIYFQQFLGNLSFSGDLRQIGVYYRHYRRLMDHWRQVLALPVLELDYEALVAEPERWIREIVAFAGLPWDERCLAFHETRRTVATLSYDQVRQPIYTSSVGRWRHYERHLEPLYEGLGERLA